MVKRRGMGSSTKKGFPNCSHRDRDHKDRQDKSRQISAAGGASSQDYWLRSRIAYVGPGSPGEPLCHPMRVNNECARKAFSAIVAFHFRLPTRQVVGHLKKLHGSAFIVSSSSSPAHSLTTHQSPLPAEARLKGLSVTSPQTSTPPARAIPVRRLPPTACPCVLPRRGGDKCASSSPFCPGRAHRNVIGRFQSPASAVGSCECFSLLQRREHRVISIQPRFAANTCPMARS